MIRVNLTGQAFGKTPYKLNTSNSTEYQTAPLTGHDSFEHGNTVSFGAATTRIRNIRKFVPSENFIEKKWLSPTINKILPSGEKIKIKYRLGKKIAETITIDAKHSKILDYGRSGKLILTTDEYYSDFNKKLKSVEINSKGDKITSHYDSNEIVREEIIEKKLETEYHKYDGEHKPLKLNISSIENDGSVMKTKYNPDIDPTTGTHKPIKSFIERKDGTYIRVYYKDGKLSSAVGTMKTSRNEVVTIETLYNDNEKIIQHKEKFKNGQEQIINYTPDGERLESRISIKLLDEATECREEVYYGENKKPDCGIIFLNGEVTYHTKFDEKEMIYEILDADGYSVPIETVNKIINREERYVADSWQKANSLEDVIPDLNLFNKISAN